MSRAAPRTVPVFLTDRRGNFAITAAVAIIPLVLTAGVAMDFSRSRQADSRLQHALDAATLAASKTMDATSEGQAKTFIKKYMEATLSAAEYKAVKQVTVKIDKTTMTMLTSANATIDAAFGPLVGIKTMDYNAEAGVKRSDGLIEAALVLDNTGSMEDEGKLDSLKTAATNFVNRMIPATGGSGKVKIALVPFSEYVNVGVDKRGSSWLSVPASTTAQSCYETRDVISKSGCSTQTYSYTRDGKTYTSDYEQCTDYVYGEPYQTCSSQTTMWYGCVGSRTYPLNVQDGSYGTRVPAYMDTAPTNSRCPSALTELTDNRSVLLGKVDAMGATGNTYIPGGLTWGRRVLSSQTPFTGGVAKSEVTAGRARKALVLMTDGRNTISKNPTSEKHDQSDSAATDLLTLELCAAIKAEGTEIYTLSFGSDVPPATKTMLETCSSGTGYAFDATTAAQLETAFGIIADSISKVYLTR